MEEIVRFVKKHRRFAVTSHARPDGDAIGSALGLALALEGLGKEAAVFNADPPPRPYGFLPGIEKMRITRVVEGDYDALVLLECNNLERPGIAGLERYFSINIDHHPNTDSFANINWVDPSAAAVGQMVYQLLLGLEAPITPDIATHLYVAIMTDTGSFQFSNTHADTFRIVSDLVNSGADPSGIAQAVYMNQPHSKIRLLGLLLETVEVHPSGKIACITLTRRMLEETGASSNDVEGIVNYPLSIEGVVMAAFLREEPDGGWRVSLRSKDNYDVGRVAETFGGGGHRNAAGLSVGGGLEEARHKVCQALSRLVI